MVAAIAPQALGYVGVRAKDLGDWASYGSGLLGLQRIDKSRSTLAFRMDDRKQRIIVDADGGEGIGFFGWEVADARALKRSRQSSTMRRSKSRREQKRSPTSATSRI